MKTEHPSIERKRISRWTVVVLPILLLSVGCVGAEEEDAPPPPESMSATGLGFGGALSGSCDGDETMERSCSIYIQQANGVTSCWAGIQFCDGGAWSQCFGLLDDPRSEAEAAQPVVDP